MKIRILLTLLFVIQLSLSQNTKPHILKKIYTDKQIYIYGDTVRITIRAINTSSMVDTLTFPDLCDAYPYVDSTDYLMSFHLGCFFAVSERVIKANDSIEWKFNYPHEYNPEHKILVVGSHNVFGYFRDAYSNTDTISFVVKQQTNGVEKELHNDNYLLNQNYPNPFNPSTNISFSLKGQSYVSLIIYDALGQEVEVIYGGVMSSGFHEIKWIPQNISAGIYYYSIVTSYFSETKKLIFMK